MGNILSLEYRGNKKYTSITRSYYHKNWINHRYFYAIYRRFIYLCRIKAMSDVSRNLEISNPPNTIVLWYTGNFKGPQLGPSRCRERCNSQAFLTDMKKIVQKKTYLQRAQPWQSFWQRRLLCRKQRTCAGSRRWRRKPEGMGIFHIYTSINYLFSHK